MKFFYYIILLLLLTQITTAYPVMTEIMYYPSDGVEWIEIYENNTANLTDYYLYEQEVNHYIRLHKGNTTLNREYAIIADDPEEFIQQYPDYNGSIFDSVYSLKNSGEFIAITNSTKDIIDEVNYTSEWGGYRNGHSICLVNGSWVESNETGGSPGLTKRRRR
jgi:hypothetical protein